MSEPTEFEIKRSAKKMKESEEDSESVLSVRDLLLSMIADIDDGGISPDTVIVIHLDSKDEAQWAQGYYATGCRSSQRITMAEVAKTQFLKDMGY